MADKVSRNTRASKRKWRETLKKREGGKKKKKGKKRHRREKRQVEARLTLLKDERGVG
jgi:hypothetical protein